MPITLRQDAAMAPKALPLAEVALFSSCSSSNISVVEHALRCLWMYLAGCPDGLLAGVLPQGAPQIWAIGVPSSVNLRGRVVFVWNLRPCKTSGLLQVSHGEEVSFAFSARIWFRKSGSGVRPGCPSARRVASRGRSWQASRP